MQNSGGSEPDSLDFGSPPEVRVGVYQYPKKGGRMTKKKRTFLQNLYRKKKSKEEKECKVDDEMTRLGVPDFLQDSYLKGSPAPVITQLRDWQVSLLSNPDWNMRRSAVVLVPTSGGKTVAADVAIAQMLHENPQGKAIFALPYVALANEKFNEYRQRFEQFIVRPYYQNVGGSDFRKGRIAICTYEKAHSLLNAAISGGYISQIKLIVIDEVHMIGEEGRGSVIEGLIIKLLLMNHCPRIVALTATVNEDDAKRLAKWINGFAFICRSRPAPIRQMIKQMDGQLCQISDGKIIPFLKLKSSDDDKDHILPLIRSLLSKKPESNIIVFVNSRKETQTIATLIASRMYDDTIQLPKVPPPSEEIMKKRVELIKKISANSGFIDNTTKKCAYAGVLFHHAGLLLEDRTLIEEAARSKTISVLVATTTLSAGVNIHGVARVIIHNIYRQLNNRKKLITASQYTQMVGRAGRNGSTGESYIIAHSNTPSEMNDIIELSKNIIPNVVSHLTDGEEVDKYFLHCISTRLLPSDGMKEYVSKCLRFNDEENKEIDGVCHSMVSRLRQNCLVDEHFCTTRFGMAVAGSALSIEEGIELNKILNQAQRNLCIDDEVHLLYLCVSPNTASSIRKFSYNSDLWQHIFKEHKMVISLITKMNDSQIDHMQDIAYMYGNNGRINPEIDCQLDRVMAAVILKDLINEVSLKDICKKFDIEFGTVQKLQMESASYAGQINKFCEILGAGVLAAALNKFRQRLNFAARTDLLALMSIPSCSRDMARALVEKGILSPVDLSMLSVEQCAALIVNDSTSIDIDTREKATKLLKDAVIFADSLAKIEELEDKAILNIQ